MGLPAKPIDGQLAVLKVGSGQDTTYIRLRWNATRERWVGEPWAAVRSTDQVGLALDIEPFTTKQYVPLTNAPTYGNDFSSPDRCGEACAAGLALEYRQAAEIAGNGAGMHVGAYFYEYNDGDYNSPGGKSNAEEAYTTPPTGGFAETEFLHTATTEPSVREQVAAGWLPLQTPGGAGIATVTKELIYPAMYAYMDPGSTGSGLVYDYALWLRWVL